MAQNFIRFDVTGDAVSWLQLDAEGHAAASGHGPLAEVAASLAGQRVVVLVPGEEVVMYRTAVPGHKRRLLAQAVPYALEEQLADDVERLHFSFGRIENDEVAVAVVSRDVITSWLARLHEAGIEVTALVPDYLSLPLAENSWRMLHQGETVIVRTGEQSGTAMDAANAAVYLDMLVAEATDKPAEITLTEFSDTPMALENLPVDVQRQTATDLPLKLMAKGYDERSAINLLQGQFSRSERIGQYWRPWRAAIVMLVVWLGLQLTLSVIDYRQLSAEKKSLHAEIEQSYRDAFPEARKVVNPRVQMERGLKALRGGGAAGSGGFSDLLSQAGEKLQATANIELQRVSYKSGVLDVSLLIGDLQQLDQLKQKLSEDGQLEVEIQSASSRGNQIDARLRIKGQS